MRQPAGKTEDRSEGKAIAGSEKYSVGDRARQRAQRSVFAAQQVVGKIQSSQHVERAADNADQRQRVLIHDQGNVMM